MAKINKTFELHITVEPIEAVTAAFDIATPYAIFGQRAIVLGWKTSMFDHDDVDDIAGKWFMTRHTETKGGAKALMVLALTALKDMGYQVTRWKIEKIIMDSKHGSDIDDLA